MTPSLSIVICTFNRAALLKMAIESVILPNKNLYNYEIIVVDNNSTDGTRTVVEDYAARYSQIRYFFEENQGLSFARNRGWKEAKGEYVIYLDDDAKASDGWLSAAAQVAEEYSPDLFGGPFFAFYLQPKPVWFKDEYGTHSYGEKSRTLNPGEFLTGGNMAVRRILLLSLNGFRTDFGMNGTKVAYGEETELQLRIRQENSNARVYYEPKMSILHLVRKEKMDLNYLFLQMVASGRDNYRVFNLSSNFSNISYVTKHKLILKSLLDLSILVFHMIINYTWKSIFRDNNKYPFPKNYIYECCLLDAGRLGYLIAQFSHIFKTKTIT